MEVTEIVDDATDRVSLNITRHGLHLALSRGSLVNGTSDPLSRNSDVDSSCHSLELSASLSNPCCSSLLNRMNACLAVYTVIYFCVRIYAPVIAAWLKYSPMSGG